MNCWRIQNLLAPYLDGVLPGIEHEAFATHLGDCPDCERIVADIAALPSFEALDISGEDSALVLDALSQTIAERIAAAAPSIREDGSDLPDAEAGGGRGSSAVKGSYGPRTACDDASASSGKPRESHAARQTDRVHEASDRR